VRVTSKTSNGRQQLSSYIIHNRPIHSDSLFDVAAMDFLFGKPMTTVKEKKDPADLAKEWRRNLAKEARVIDRDVILLLLYR
jgi:hypothetical protein